MPEKGYVTPMLHRLIACLALTLSLAFLSSPARADWYEASSDHFVIYADDSAKDLKKYAENLERYHSAMEYLTRRKTEKPSPSNRVVVFVVGNEREVQKLAGGDSRYVGGFYIPRAGASRAFVQDIRNTNGYPHHSTIILLHEYAHHFLISSTRYPMPRWMSEGAAEFFAAATFNKDGSVLIGRPALHRAQELAFADEVPIRELLDPELYEQNKGKKYDAFYGRSWLLYHYLTFNPERRGQETKYWLEVLNGTDPVPAGEKVFGDLDTLEKELKAYAREKRMFTFDLPPERLNASAVTIRKLSEGEAAAMPLRMRSQRGVNEEQAAELVIEARAVAAKYPDDAGVLSMLAEAEHDAGNDAAAIAAADKAIAIDPSRTNPYVQKGFSLFRMARDAEDANAAYKEAMKPFQALNARETNHPLPLIYYYRSFAERGIEPPEDAKTALEQAASMAPFDQGLWLNVARMQMQEGKIALARDSLKPLAADPHGSPAAAQAKLLLALLANMSEGQKLDIDESDSGFDDEDDGDIPAEEAEQPADEEG